MIFTQPPSDFNPRFEVVSCFINHDGKFLLLHRQDNDEHQPNIWGLPAGKREANETTMNGILREISEETGLRISEPQITSHGSLYVRYPDHDFLYHAYATNLETKPEIILNPTEHKSYTWVTPEEALQMKLITDLDACIKLYFKMEE